MAQGGDLPLQFRVPRAESGDAAVAFRQCLVGIRRRDPGRTAIGSRSPRFGLLALDRQPSM